MAFERKKVGEDWTDSDKDFKTTGTLESGAQTVTGAIDASGEITGATVVQGSDPVLDESDLIAGGGTIIGESDIVNTGPSVPTSTFAGKFWFDTANNLLKMRNEADNGWLDIWDTANDKPIIDNFVDEITGLMLASAVAGDGLVQDGSGNLDINVDDSSIELSGDALRVKALGITEAKLAAALVVEIEKTQVSANDDTRGYLNGKLVEGNNIALTENDDGSDETLTVDTKFRGAVVTTKETGTHQSIPDGVFTSIIFNTTYGKELYDTDNFHDMSTNPTRLTVPAGVSFARFKGSVKIASSAAGTIRYVRITKNGSNNLGLAVLENLPFEASVGSDGHVETPVLAVSENDYFELQVSQDTGGALDVLDSAPTSTWFAIEVVE